MAYQLVGVLRPVHDVDVCLAEQPDDPLAGEHRVIGDDCAHRTPLGYAPLQDETPADRAEPILERNEERRSLRTVVLDGDAMANSLERHVAISTFAPDGSDFTEVITGGFNPHWSPDGSRSRTRCQPGARRTQEEPLSRWPTRTARTFGCSTSAA
ncbi:MAG TPA: hypothetical protein VFT80_15530 [Actinomycetota bacterium]|nr:hypothetical protein [Actinomycetota bacterium]